MANLGETLNLTFPVGSGEATPELTSDEQIPLLKYPCVS